MTGPGPAGGGGLPAFALGDRLTLRKPHACGGATWLVTRVGADLGLTCERCGRRLMLERRAVEWRLVALVPAGEEAP